MDDYRELSWDDQIEKEGGEFVLLPEGDYDFTIKKYERARYTPSATSSIPACNMAKVTFTIWGENDSVDIVDNFFLHSKMERKLSQLFLSIGAKKHGEALKMNWNLVPGGKGKCRIYVDSYTKKDGNTGKSNKIKKLYAYDEVVKTVNPLKEKAAPSPQNKWTAGDF